MERELILDKISRKNQKARKEKQSGSMEEVIRKGIVRYNGTGNIMQK
jgi:hypothetical protein